MSILITFLTLVLVVNCVLLILLVLIQLPKKEAGAGLAFGAGTTDALFGAGSGNALTKVTKYAAIFFLGLALVIGILNSKNDSSSSAAVRKLLATQRPATTPAAAPVAAPAASQFNVITNSNLSIVAPTNAVRATNIPAAPAATNAAPK